MKGKKPGVLALQCFHSTETNPGQSENWVWHVDILLSSGGLLHWLWHVNKPEENVFVSFQWPTFLYLRISRKLPKPRADFRSPSFCACELLCSASPKKKKKQQFPPKTKKKTLFLISPLLSCDYSKVTPLKIIQSVTDTWILLPKAEPSGNSCKSSISSIGAIQEKLRPKEQLFCVTLRRVR